MKPKKKMVPKKSTAAKRSTPAPRAETKLAPQPAPRPVDESSEPIAPLWDLPDISHPIRIPVRLLTSTLVHKLELIEGHEQSVYCGALGPQATKDDIRRKWGGGKYLIKARVRGRIERDHVFTIEGAGKDTVSMFTSPVHESNSGLISLVEADPLASFIWTQSQTREAQIVEQCDKLLGFVTNITQTQAEQIGSMKMVGFLESRNRELMDNIDKLRAQVSAKDEQILKMQQQQHEKEIETIRNSKTKHTIWHEFAEAAMETAPELLDKFPVIAQALDRTIAKAAGFEVPPLQPMPAKVSSNGNGAPSQKRTTDVTTVKFKSGAAPAGLENAPPPPAIEEGAT